MQYFCSFLAVVVGVHVEVEDEGVGGEEEGEFGVFGVEDGEEEEEY